MGCEDITIHGECCERGSFLGCDRLKEIVIESDMLPALRNITISDCPSLSSLAIEGAYSGAELRLSSMRDALS